MWRHMADFHHPHWSASSGLGRKCQAVCSLNSLHWTLLVDTLSWSLPMSQHHTMNFGGEQLTVLENDLLFANLRWCMCSKLCCARVWAERLAPRQRGLTRLYKAPSAEGGTRIRLALCRSHRALSGRGRLKQIIRACWPTLT